MYCPSCGSEERQLSQFCRACGTDLRVVRNSLENPDAITQSAISARENIGMAVADKIRQMSTAKELKKVAEEVLPHFEKFLELSAIDRVSKLAQHSIAWLSAGAVSPTISTALGAG